MNKIKDIPMRHPQADLLIYAAEHKDAEFICIESSSNKGVSIDFVLLNPDADWKIKPKPITKWQWAYRIYGGDDWKITPEYYTEAQAGYRCVASEWKKLEFTAKEFTE